jgi:hypothetical protein
LLVTSAVTGKNTVYATTKDNAEEEAMVELLWGFTNSEAF